ncbi:hypothetical protein GM418_24800 [Maribellus comscasis]|uniref:Uncharacterized protein n=1 Tax=Maribellus comscasis TaxID=2681766 RepID=A0A6I6JZZ9_9BACT|nr:hypothetical protein [Maribellus comscasis]QGY46758.1 hypothetical protein GM418_24800 [Maribellus comscasis]
MPVSGYGFTNTSHHSFSNIKVREGDTGATLPSRGSPDRSADKSGRQPRVNYFTITF